VIILSLVILSEVVAREASDNAVEGPLISAQCNEPGETLSRCCIMGTCWGRLRRRQHL